MAGYKVVLLFIIFQVVNSKPFLFKEVNIKKNFDLSIKHHELKPITFIKEKWMHFATKHAIVKRSPFELAPVPVKKEDAPPPIFRVALEKSIEAGSPPPPRPPPIPEGITPIPPMFVPEKTLASQGPAVSVPPSLVSTPPPIIVTPDHLSRLPLEGIEDVVIVTPIPPPPPLKTPNSVPVPAGIVPTPIPPQIIASPGPVPIPGPPPPAASKGLVQGNLLTDIARVDEINAYLKAVEALAPPPPEPPLEPSVLPVVTGNSIEPETPKEPPIDEKLNSSPLVKGSRLALYFGNILLQVMSEVISSARSAISQYSQPAPI